MRKFLNKIFLLISFLLIFLLTGCANSEENLENYYYVMAIGIDKGENTKINLSVQIATNSSGSQDSDSGSSQSNSSNIYSTPCNSIDSGISILNNFLSKRINISHCSAIIFSQELAEEGIKDYINTLGNNAEIRPTCNIMVSSTTGFDALEKISNSLENFSSRYYEFIKSSTKYTGYSVTPELSEFFYCLNFSKNSCFASYVTVSDEAIQNTGIAVFDGDRLSGNLTVLDSISYALITDRLESSTISIKSPKNENKTIDVLIKQTRKPEITCTLINNYPFIKIKTSLEYDILSSTYELDTDSPEGNKILEDSINLYIEKIISNFLYEISHKYDADICNFKNEMLKNYLTLEDFEKIHWDEIYKDSYFEVEINGKIENLGMFSQE